MINYGSHYIDKNDIKAVNKVLRSKSLTNGKEVEHFEKSINKYFGCKGSAVVSSGTAALHLAGIILGWNKNDIILTVPNTFVATVNSIIYSGATPDLVDINPTTFSIDPKELAAKGYNKRSSEHLNLYGNNDFDKDIFMKYLSHENLKNLKGLEIEMIFKWKLGELLIFDRSNLHCSSQNIINKKLGFTSSTKKL